MRDNLDPRESRITPGRAKSPQTPPARPLADREVPLTGRQTPDTVHAWLDGELPEAAVRQGDTVRDVEFWLRIDRDVEVRRQMKTPVHVYQQIMDALPQTAPEVSPWWHRPFELTPLLAIIATAGLLVLGLALGSLVAHAR